MEVKIKKLNKPLDKASLDYLENTIETLKKQFLSNIKDNISKINHDNFKTISNDDYISIIYTAYKNLEAIKLDITKEPPVLTSTIYKKDWLKTKLENLEIWNKNILKELEKLKKELQTEQIKQENMKKDNKNFEEYITDKDYDKYHKQTIATTKIEDQQNKILKITLRIKKLEYTYYINNTEIDALKKIEENLKEINLENFEEIRNLLEKTLGIDIESTDTAYIQTEENGTNSKIYKIGKKEFSINYKRRKKDIY